MFSSYSTHVAFRPLDLYLIHTNMMHEITIHASRMPPSGAHTNTRSLDTDALSGASAICEDSMLLYTLGNGLTSNLREAVPSLGRCGSSIFLCVYTQQ